MLGKTLERELAFQKEVAQKSMIAMSPVPGYVIQRYTVNRNWRIFAKERIFRKIRHYVMKSGHKPVTISEFGCGDGSYSCQIAMTIDNVKISSFDISPEIIEAAKMRAAINDVSDKISYFIADAEKNPTQGKQFDVTLALNMLHHVNIEKVVPNLVKATKPGGMIVLVEPIAFSENLQKIREKTPVSKNVSPDERQLAKHETDYIVNKIENAEAHYYYLFARLTRLFPNASKADRGHLLTKYALIVIGWFDFILLKIFPFLKKYSGRVILFGYAPTVRK